MSEELALTFQPLYRIITTVLLPKPAAPPSAPAPNPQAHPQPQPRLPPPSPLETYLRNRWSDTLRLKPEQARVVIKFAMSPAKLCDTHVLKFFGNDGRDKGLRLNQDKFLMPKAWHASVPTLIVAFNLSSANFVSKMHDIEGFGQPNWCLRT